MSTIPSSITEKQFESHISPCLSTAKRGYISKIPLYKIFNYILYRLHTGCQWNKLPIEKNSDDKKEISHDAVAYHFRKWSRDGSLQAVWENSIITIMKELNMNQLHIDGTHTIAKKGGSKVKYQGRKRAKTSNIIPITDGNGFIIASTKVIAGNHNDSWQIKIHLQDMFKRMKKIGLNLTGAYLNGDPAFDTKDARKTCFNHGIYPNFKENRRNRKGVKRGRKRKFDSEAYKLRYISERTWAWVDKFRALTIRYDRDDRVFLGGNHIAFTMINLRHLILPE